MWAPIGVRGVEPSHGYNTVSHVSPGPDHMTTEYLPDCRAQVPKGLIRGQGGNWVPIFCANCGKPSGAVPAENMTFIFYLCNYCVETHGAIASTMMVPDEVFWSEVAAEHQARQAKEEG